MQVPTIELQKAAWGKQVLKEQTEMKLVGLVRELGEVTDGYVHVRLREILYNTPWSYILRALPNITETKALHRLVVNCYLAICGLSDSRIKPKRA